MKGKRAWFSARRSAARAQCSFKALAVNKAFGPVPELVDAGHRVIFDGGGSYIENAQGHKTKIRRSNDMWYLDFWRVSRHIASDQN